MTDSINDQTIAAYNQFAEVYDAEVVEFWDNFPQTTVAAFVEALPGRTILDLGSGSGRDAIILREAGCDVECIDGSSEMVEMTRKMGFTTRLVRFEELVLPERAYDGVWAYTSLLHVEQPVMEQILERVVKALPVNGVLLLGMIEGEFAGMVERESMPGVGRYFRYYPAEELRALVEPLGLTRIFEEHYAPRSKAYVHQLYVKG